MNSININELEERQLIAKTTNEQLSFVKALAAAFSLKGLLVHHETLLPGRKSSSAHYHTKKDELIFVLKGNPSVRMNGEIVRLKAGDVFGFPSGAGISHVIVNESDSPTFFLSIGSSPSEDEAIYA